MKIVRVRISGWAIQHGNDWMFKFGMAWSCSPSRELAHVFKRLSEAEKWLAENN